MTRCNVARLLDATHKSDLPAWATIARELLAGWLDGATKLTRVRLTRYTRWLSRLVD